MNKLTHKLCKACNTPYPHYNSSFTKCPRCEELKQLKGNEKDKAKRNINPFLEQPRFNKFNIKSNRAGNKLRKLTSEPEETDRSGSLGISSWKLTGSKGKSKKVQAHKIPAITAKQARINAEAEKIKKQIEHDRDPCCESCGYHYNLDPSHAIPVSKRKDLELDPEGIFVQCRSYMGRVGCHEKWEHQMLDCLKFKNLDKMLAYVKSKDEGRYLFIINKLNYQLEYSK